MLNRALDGCHQFFLILFISTMIMGNLTAADLIEWEPYEEADHYLVEFRQDGDLIAVFRSEISSLPVTLLPGKYEFRILVMSPFGKEMIASQWEEVQILSNLVPVILSFSPGEIYLNREPVFTARIAGYREILGESFEFQLENSEGNTIPLVVETSRVQNTTDNIWDFVFQKPKIKDLSAGKWNFLIKNVNTNRSNMMSGALTVHEHFKPILKAVVPGRIRIGKKYNELTLKLSGMEKNIEIIFNGPSDLDPVFLQYTGNNRLLYSLNLQDAEPGWYSISLKNPSGESYVKKRALKLLKPSDPDSLSARISNDINQMKPRPVPEFPNSISLGYTFSMPIVRGLSLFEYSLTGFMVGFSRDISNEILRRLPALNGLGWEISFLLTTTERLHLYVDNVDTLHFMLIMGLRYITPWNFPVKLLFRFGAGFTSSIYTSTDYDRTTDIGDHTLSDLDSLDLTMRAGAGFYLDISPRLFLNIVFNASSIFFYNNTYIFLQPAVEGGFRW